MVSGGGSLKFYLGAADVAAAAAYAHKLHTEKQLKLLVSFGNVRSYFMMCFPQ